MRQVARTAVAALSAGLISQAAPGCTSKTTDEEAADQVEQSVEPEQQKEAPVAEPAPEQAADRVRGPMVMPYGIKGPRVMPDPHMARDNQRIEEQAGEGDAAVSGSQVVVRTDVEIASVMVKGSLSENVVRRGVKRRLNEVRSCCERELGAKHAETGRVTVKFIISSTGAVQMAAVADTTLAHARTDNCIARAVRDWVFPAPKGGGIVIATVAFDISPRAKSKSEEGE
jgi:hypothetical protein